MPSKSINHGILKAFHSDNIRTPIRYYPHTFEKELLRKVIGRGIRIGDLVSFKAEHPIDKTMRPIDKIISEVNDKPQFKASVHLDELNNTFIFDHSGERKDADEIVQN